MSLRQLFLFIFSFVCCMSLRAQVFEGVATHFEGLGTPYGGCGVPQELLETQHFVALNVFHSPGMYGDWETPITGQDTIYMGAFNNGYECGRWIRVTIGEYCTGINDGAPGQPFCRGEGARWIDDEYSGAVLDMIVTDACPDPNAWCRDDRFHLDMSSVSLDHFKKDGQYIKDIYPMHWNNRKVYWQYIEAPDYTGDVSIYFMKGAQQYWPAILITHLRNGISGVEQKVDGDWVPAQRNGDMGQSFILTDHNRPYTIRIYDANGALVNNGREYTIDLSAQCGSACSQPTTQVDYQTFDPLVTNIPGSRGKDGSLAIQIKSSSFEIAQHAGSGLIQIYDVQGTKVSNIRFFPGRSYELSALSNGMYIYTVAFDQGYVTNGKLLINR